MLAQLDADYIRTRPLKVFSRLVSHLLFQGRPLTTRWQWLNPLLFAQFSFIKCLPQLQKVEKPIYIVGIGRSGTTILGKVLSIHPHVNFLNEPKALWHAVYPEEDVIGSYSRGPGRYRLGSADVSPQVQQTAHRLYGYCLAITVSKRILDKYSAMIFRESFVRAIFPDAKFIFLVRNGWDMARSIEAWSQRFEKQKDHEIHDWWGADRRQWRLLVEDIIASEPAFAQSYAEILSFTSHRDMAVVEWIAAMREGLSLMQSIPDAIYQVHYEELTANPEQTLENLLKFCELPSDAKLLSYAKCILSPSSSHQPFPIHPAIEGLFLETMEMLNYQVGRRS